VTAKPRTTPASIRQSKQLQGQGGGTVYFPAGTYLTGSIHLRSNITLQFEHGTRLEASADPPPMMPLSPTSGTSSRDFGHSHFHNSLIWGENLENVSIIGGGLSAVRLCHVAIAAQTRQLR